MSWGDGSTGAGHDVSPAPSLSSGRRSHLGSPCSRSDEARSVGSGSNPPTVSSMSPTENHDWHVSIAEQMEQEAANCLAMADPTHPVSASADAFAGLMGSPEKGTSHFAAGLCCYVEESRTESLDVGPDERLPDDEGGPGGLLTRHLHDRLDALQKGAVRVRTSVGRGLEKADETGHEAGQEAGHEGSRAPGVGVGDVAEHSGEGVGDSGGGTGQLLQLLRGLGGELTEGVGGESFLHESRDAGAVRKLDFVPRFVSHKVYI